MFEAALVAYVFTGIFKRILSSVHITLPVDITFLIGVLTIFVAVAKSYNEKSFSFNELFQKTKKYKAVYFLGVFYLWCLVTLAYGKGQYYPLKKSIYFLTNLIPVAALFIYSKVNLKKFSHYFIGLSFILSVFYFITSPDMRYYKNPDLYFLNYGHLKGMFLTATIMLGISVFLTFRFIDNVFLKIHIVYFFVFSLLYSSARGSYMSMLVCMVIFIFLYRKKALPLWQQHVKPIWKKTTVSLFAITVLLAVMIANDVDKMATLNRSLYKMNLLVGSVGSKDNAYSIANFMDENLLGDSEAGQERLMEIKKEANSSIFARVWHTAFVLNTLKDNPDIVLWGAGFGSYGTLCCGTDDRSNYPHNVFLEIWIETGIIGVIIFSGFLFFIFQAGINKGFLWMITFSVLFIFLNMLKSFSLVDIRIFFMFASLLLFVLPQHEHEGNKKIWSAI